MQNNTPIVRAVRYGWDNFNSKNIAWCLEVTLVSGDKIELDVLVSPKVNRGSYCAFEFELFDIETHLPVFIDESAVAMVRFAHYDEQGEQ